METRPDQAAQDKVFDLIKDIHVAQMVTIDGAGKLRGRPMVGKQKKFEGELCSCTPTDT